MESAKFVHVYPKFVHVYPADKESVGGYLEALGRGADFRGAAVDRSDTGGSLRHRCCDISVSGEACH